MYADKRSFASVAIRVIRGYILRALRAATAECGKDELGTQELKKGA